MGDLIPKNPNKEQKKLERIMIGENKKKLKKFLAIGSYEKLESKNALFSHL